MNSQKDPTISTLLDDLHTFDRDRARESITATRRELRETVERFNERLESTPADLDNMTLDDLETLVGELYETAGFLEDVADRAAVALDDLQSEVSND